MDVVDDDEDDDEWEGMRLDTETVAQALGDSSGAHGLIAASSLHIHHHHQHGHHHAVASLNKPNRPASASIQRPPAGTALDLVSSRARARPASASVKGSRSSAATTGSGTAVLPVGYVARPGSAARQGAPVHVVNIGMGEGAGNLVESDVEVEEDEGDGFSDAAEDYCESDHDMRLRFPEGAIPQGHGCVSNVRPATANEAHRRGAAWSSQHLGGGKGGGYQSRQRPASATSRSPSSHIGPFRTSPYSPNGGQGYLGGQAASPTSRKRESAKARSDRLASAGAERRLRSEPSSCDGKVASANGFSPPYVAFALYASHYHRHLVADGARRRRISVHSTPNGINQSLPVSLVQPRDLFLFFSLPFPAKASTSQNAINIL